MNNVTAIVLGGGRGSRLAPLTLERAKPAVGFAGKYRLIDIPLSNCIHSGIKRIFVLTQFLSASLHRHIKQSYHFDKFTDGFVDVLAAEQTVQQADWFQGTADAVRATLNHTMYYRANQMLILSGDHLYRMNYADLLRFHRENRADITLCVYPVARKEAPQMGLLKVDASGRVEEFLEKPKDKGVIAMFRAPQSLLESRGASPESERFLASMGIYVFEPATLRKALADESLIDFGKELIPAAVKRYRVMAYPFMDYWQDIGTIEAFFESNISLAQPNPPFQLYSPKWPFFTHARLLPPARVVKSEIRDSLLVEGADINGARILDSIVGMRSIIRQGSLLEEVVMLGADFYEGEQLLSSYEDSGADPPLLGIGKNCRIERAIIDKNARIGDDVVIRAKGGKKDFQADNYWIREGITIIPRGAIIPSGTEL